MEHRRSTTKTTLELVQRSESESLSSSHAMSTCQASQPMMQSHDNFNGTQSLRCRDMLATVP
eukprot:1492700-Amphidinium_carterae.1